MDSKPCDLGIWLSTHHSAGLSCPGLDGDNWGGGVPLLPPSFPAFAWHSPLLPGTLACSQPCARELDANVSQGPSEPGICTTRQCPPLGVAQPLGASWLLPPWVLVSDTRETFAWLRASCVSSRANPGRVPRSNPDQGTRARLALKKEGGLTKVRAAPLATSLPSGWSVPWLVRGSQGHSTRIPRLEPRPLPRMLLSLLPSFPPSF